MVWGPRGVASPVVTGTCPKKQKSQLDCHRIPFFARAGYSIVFNKFKWRWNPCTVLCKELPFGVVVQIISQTVSALLENMHESKHVARTAPAVETLSFAALLSGGGGTTQRR